MKTIILSDNNKYEGTVLQCFKSKFRDDIVNKPVTELVDENKNNLLVFPASSSEMVGVKKSNDQSDNHIIDKVFEDAEESYYITRNIAGFIGDGTNYLTITSRFVEAPNKDYFFYYLLSRVINGLNLFKYIETSFNNDNNVDINILMFMFPLTLKNALRKGLYKTYRRNEYNNSNIKGTIDFSRHIKLNIPFVGNVAYSQREFSFDNPITQLIRHTIECIKKKTFGCELLNLAKDDVRQIVSVTQSFKRQDKSRVISSVRKNTAISAYFSEYRQLVKLCLMILQHDGQKLGNGGHEIYGVLFDCAWLWEEYVNTLICEMFIHPQNKSGKGGRKLLWTDDNEDIQTIYPDFIGKNIKDGKGIKVIADAKYKPYGVNKIDRDDYYQVLAYMFRFDASVGLYIYPEDNAAKSYDFKRQHLYTGFKDEKRIPEEDIYLIKAGIKIPKDAKDGDDFIQKMSANEDEFVKRIKRIVG